MIYTFWEVSFLSLYTFWEVLSVATTEILRVLAKCVFPLEIRENMPTRIPLAARCWR